MTIRSSVATGGHATDAEIVDLQGGVNELLAAFSGGTAPPSGAAGGDLGGTYPNPTVTSIANVTTGTLTTARGGTGQTATGTSGQLLQSTGTTAAQWAGETAWTAVAGGIGFTNSWVDQGGGIQTAGYFKDASGFVHLRGGIKNGTAATPAFTLPAAYRPANYIRFPVAGNGAYGQIDIANTGTVTPTVGGTAQIHLDGITFDTRT